MIAIVTDSTCDLPAHFEDSTTLSVVPAVLHLDGTTLRDGVDIDRPAFYRRLPGLSALPRTAAPSPTAFAEVYERLLHAASAVVSIHAASQLSGIWNAARLAAGQVSPGRIHVLDSGQVSMGLGWPVLAALRAAGAGEPLEAVIHCVHDTLGRVRVFAAMDTLEFLARSGRVNMVQVGLSSLLSIKPIIELHDGAVSSAARARTWSRAVSALAERIHQLAPLERLAVMHANALDSAHELLERVRQVLPEPPHVLVTDATTVIGTHVGPGAVGFAAVTVHPTRRMNQTDRENGLIIADAN